jgi:hypothetical protein
VSGGFARMSPERRRLIAQRGNKKLREQGREHRFTSDEAREAVEAKQKRATDGNTNRDALRGTRVSEK